jgi:hypothetical protein
MRMYEKHIVFVSKPTMQECQKLEQYKEYLTAVRNILRNHDPDEKPNEYTLGKVADVLDDMITIADRMINYKTETGVEKCEPEKS